MKCSQSELEFVKELHKLGKSTAEISTRMGWSLPDTNTVMDAIIRDMEANGEKEGDPPPVPEASTLKDAFQHMSDCFFSFGQMMNVFGNAVAAELQPPELEPIIKEILAMPRLSGESMERKIARGLSTRVVCIPFHALPRENPKEEDSNASKDMPTL